MSKFDEDISLPEVIDVEPKEVSTTVKPVPASEKDIDNDYDHVRASLHMLDMKGQEALDSALEIATESEHPRAFEVVGGLIKTLSDNNKNIMDLHKQVKELKEKPKEEKTEVTNNNLVISTADLQKMLKGQ